MARHVLQWPAVLLVVLASSAAGDAPCCGKHAAQSKADVAGEVATGPVAERNRHSESVGGLLAFALEDSEKANEADRPRDETRTKAGDSPESSLEHADSEDGGEKRALTELATKETKPRLLKPSKSTYASERFTKDASLRESLSESDTFERLKKALKTVEVDGETFWVAESDLLLDEDELLFYSGQREAQERIFELKKTTGEAVAQAGTPQGLVGITANGRLVRWGPRVSLRYCVLRGTFQNEQQYRTVRDNMIAATTQWEALCGCDFQYMPGLDGSSGTSIPAGAVFAVRGINANGNFIASAFFPNDPPFRRKVLIDPSYFSTSFDKVGVLRHELGHVLGFRHEHIRSEAPPECPNETPNNTINLTLYDPQSTMHYFCGGAGRPSLAFSDLDRVGAQRLYGAPLESLQFVELDP